MAIISKLTHCVKEMY